MMSQTGSALAPARRQSDRNHYRALSCDSDAVRILSTQPKASGTASPCIFPWFLADDSHNTSLISIRIYYSSILSIISNNNAYLWGCIMLQGKPLHPGHSFGHHTCNTWSRTFWNLQVWEGVCSFQGNPIFRSSEHTLFWSNRSRVRIDIGL